MKKTLLSALMLPMLAFAHGVWVAPHYGELSLIYGMGYADDAYSPDKVKDIQAFAADFTKVSLSTTPHQHHVSLEVDSEAAVVTTFFDNGFWEKNEKGRWQAVEEAAIQKPENTSTSLKYNISLLKPYTGEMKPFPHLTVQAIPSQDPSSLKQGDELSLTVYVAGKPFAGAEVTADYNHDMQNKVTTDAEGRATIKVRNNGHNVVGVWVNHQTPDHPKAHLQRNVVTLSFKSARPQAHH